MFLELVKKRKSVRRYFADKPVVPAIIGRCLEAARLAPSACNSQPWTFIVVDEPQLKKMVAEAAFSGAYSMNAFAKDAPVLVVVIRERSKTFARLGGFIRNSQYDLIDIGIACEHFILQAEEDGVGTCWLGWFDEKAVKKVLGIPKEKKADIMISMGYASQQTFAEKPRKTMQQMSSFNKGQ